MNLPFSFGLNLQIDKVSFGFYISLGSEVGFENQQKKMANAIIILKYHGNLWH